MVNTIIQTIVQAISGLLGGIGEGIVSLFTKLFTTGTGETQTISVLGVWLMVLLGLGIAVGLIGWVKALVTRKS
jgi:hypothetical protein